MAWVTRQISADSLSICEPCATFYSHHLSATQCAEEQWQAGSRHSETMDLQHCFWHPTIFFVFHQEVYQDLLWIVECCLPFWLQHEECNSGNTSQQNIKNSFCNKDKQEIGQYKNFHFSLHIIKLASHFCPLSRSHFDTYIQLFWEINYTVQISAMHITRILYFYDIVLSWFHTSWINI